MRDFSARSRSISFKKNRTGSWHIHLALFVLVIFSFVAFSSLAHNIFSNKHVAGDAWDDKSSYVAGFLKSPIYLFIFQKDPRRVAIVKWGSEQLSLQREELATNISKTLGVKVDSFIAKKVENFDDAKKTFEDFTSIITPLKILATGVDTKNTNISRFDAIKLWWQLKSIRTNEVKTLDLSQTSQASAQKVLGTTSKYLNQELSPYLENFIIVGEDIPISLVNKSGDVRSVGLAQNFITSVGGRVNSVDSGEELMEHCVVATNRKNSYSAKYLAKIFGCDTLDTISSDEDPTISLEIGKSFARKYFQ